MTDDRIIEAVGRERVPSVNGGERCRHPFHDAHEAYERAKKEAGLT